MMNLTKNTYLWYNYDRIIPCEVNLKVDIAVCDDNLSDREIIRQQLSIYFSDRFIEYNIDSYENGVNLIYSIEDGEYYDIIFLDMYMDS